MNDNDKGVQLVVAVKKSEIMARLVESACNLPRPKGVDADAFLCVLSEDGYERYSRMADSVSAYFREAFDAATPLQ